MKVNIKDYELNYPSFFQFYDLHKEDKHIIEIISTFAVYSGCPIIVIICFAERFIEKELLKVYKESIINFYGYTDIVNE